MRVYLYKKINLCISYIRLLMQEYTEVYIVDSKDVNKNYL